ncbi:MAG: MFS transporter, partial [Solobacterium sp.]|nr:MFS transporter [Solobacterium sp.]
MKKDKFLLFFVISFCFSMAANFAHPVTPTLIVERSLDSSMFGVALAAMMFMYFLFSPFWGKLCAYIPTKRIMLIGAVGYAAGQLIFGSAYTEATVIGGRMFAGMFSSGAFTAIANYVINFTQDDLKERGRKLVILSTVQNV